MRSVMSVGMACEGIGRALLDTAVRDARLYLRLVRHSDQRSSGHSAGHDFRLIESSARCGLGPQEASQDRTTGGSLVEDNGHPWLGSVLRRCAGNVGRVDPMADDAV